LAGRGDEGSVTVTQMQGLRGRPRSGASRSPSRRSPRRSTTWRSASRPTAASAIPWLAGRVAAPHFGGRICCLYSAGEYDSPLAKACLNYVEKQMRPQLGSQLRGIGDTILHEPVRRPGVLPGGRQVLGQYFPPTRDELVRLQKQDGSWNSDGIGPVFDTSVGLIILQLPYKFLPIYQR